MLLGLALSYLIPRPAGLAPVRDVVPVELDRDCLVRLGWEVVDECVEYDGLNSETTRACENPHIRHGAVVTGGLHCVPLQCIGYAGEPRQGEACC